MSEKKNSNVRNDGYRPTQVYKGYRPVASTAPRRPSPPPSGSQVKPSSSTPAGSGSNTKTET